MKGDSFMKRILLSVFILLFSIQLIVFAGSNSISIVVDGEYLIFDQPPIMENDRVLVPLRIIFEALGATVDWDESTQTITSNKGENTVVMQIGSNTFTVNATEKALDVPPQIVGIRTLVPVRAIAESFNCVVNWEDSTQTVTIDSEVKIKTEKEVISYSASAINYPKIIESTNIESMDKINSQIKTMIDWMLADVKSYADISENISYSCDYGIPNTRNNLFAVLYTSSFTMDGETQISQFADVYRLDTGEKAVLTDYFPDMSYDEIAEKIIIDFTMIVDYEPEGYYENAGELVSQLFDTAVIYPCGNEIVVTFNPGVIAPYDLGFKTITYSAEY